MYPWPLAHELLGESRDIARTDSRQSPIVSIYNCANWIWVHGFMNNRGNLRRKPLWSRKWVYRKSGHRLRYSEQNICLWLYRMAQIFVTVLSIRVAYRAKWILHHSVCKLARYKNTTRLKTELLLLKNVYLKLLGAHGGVVLKALRYKPAGRGFDSRWCHWNFSVTYSFRSHYGPGVDSASNRNEYQVYFLG